MATKKILSIGSFSLTALWCVSTAMAQVQHGYIDVVENDPNNNPESVTLTRIGGFGAWIVDPNTSNRADYTVDFGMTSDKTEGVLLVGPAQDDRTDASVLSDPNDPESLVPYFATVATAPQADPSDNYFIAVSRSSQGNEVNYNVALAYFPIIDGWQMVTLYNSTNGGPITHTVGTPGINVYTTFDEADPDVIKTPSRVIDSLASNFEVILDGVEQRRDGVPLACGAKNEDNYTAIYVEATGSASVLNNRDNGDNGGGQEQDPSTFVFIPEGTPGVVMGTVSGSGLPVFQQGEYSVEAYGAPEINGTFHLTIPGADPNTGTLIVTPRTEFSGGTVDNPAFVEYDPNFGGWQITSRDIGGMGLQDLGAFDIAFHFAYFDSSAAITPVGPTKSYVSRLDDVVSAYFEVGEVTADNGVGDVTGSKVAGASSLDYYALNRGDFGIKWLNARPMAHLNNGLDAEDGVWLGNPTEFFRDNTAVAGFSGWGTVSSDNGNMPLHIADSIGGEFNFNFAAALFPIGAGFDQDADVQVPSGLEHAAHTTDCISDALTDGVLMAINWDNNNRYVTVEPSGVDYIVRSYDATTGEIVSDWDYGYVYLPFDTPNLIGGWIDPNGAVIAGAGNFSTSTSIVSINDPFLGQIDVPVTNIDIPGVDPASDGIIVVTSMGGPFNTANFTPAWQVNGGSYAVAGWDPAMLLPDRIAFGFVYVPFDNQSLAAPLDGDLDDDGAVDGADGLLAIGCFSGEGISLVPAGCDAADFKDADLECDLDVDMINFASIQAATH